MLIIFNIFFDFFLVVKEKLVNDIFNDCMFRVIFYILVFDVSGFYLRMDVKVYFFVK